jgi:hypothetical protein
MGGKLNAIVVRPALLNMPSIDSDVVTFVT